MIRTLLIANRGEIACRVIRTARRMGLQTVAVYSDADAAAPHVRQADEAIRIGPAPAAASYLNIAAIMDAVAATGADAVHPGYGFLSENAAFAEACAAADCIFVGPPPEAIRAMGSKIEAKQRVAAAGAPVIPGYHGDDQADATLAAKASEVGFPLLIKASAGGGGKGMRLVEDAEAFAAALAGARREALAAFGDDNVLLERYLAAPKHIEVQVLADAHGNVVHLFERDCSVQRRHQKVIEEAPAPTVDAELRRRMGEAGCRVARAVNYEGAGTVEFIVEGGDFHFMEMNTRLQVEHPVTEAILGLDLVALQLRIAAGEPLPITQEALAIRGHAIEARVYAENVKRNFLPSTGRLHRVVWPHTVRVDTGVETGSEISVHYDPMMAKIIAHGADRNTAIVALREALRATEIVGVEHNVAYLRGILAHQRFAEGHYTTRMAEGEAEALVPGDGPMPLVAAALALALARHGAGPWESADGFQLNLPSTQRFALRRGRKQVEVEVAAAPDGRAWRIETAEGAYQAKDAVLRDGQLNAVVGNTRVAVAAHTFGKDVFIVKDGATERFQLQVADAGGFRYATSASRRVYAPMPGTVVAVNVAPGESVKAGQTLAVLEAMKMEHNVAAPADGKVASVCVAAGERVEEGAELLVLA